MPITVPIPGGSATLLTKRELTPRRELHVKSILIQFSDLAVRSAEEADKDGRLTAITQEQAELFARLDYASIPTYLLSWTIDTPVPTSLEEALDIPSDVAGDLIEAIKRVAAGLEVWEQFEPSDETLKDTGSPSGRSGNGRTASGASATGPKSRRTSKNS